MGKMDLQRITECAADFFVTGNGYVRDSLNLKFIPCGRADKIAYAGGLILDLKFISRLNFTGNGLDLTFALRLLPTFYPFWSSRKTENKKKFYF